MNIQELLPKFSELKIGLIGDLIKDIYVIGEVNRISPEAPVQVLNVKETRHNWGGAGNVYHNLKGLGAEVSFFHNDNHVPKKTRIMCGPHHLLRLDEEDAPQWQRWDDIDIGLGYGIYHEKFNCVVISDYGKGMISREVADKVIELCGMKGIPVVVDSKRDLTMFAGSTLVKCNHKEWASQCLQHRDDPWSWLKENTVENLVITNGDRGMQYHGHHGGLELSGNIPGIETHIADSCGAGDTVTAVLACMIALGEPVDDACTLANTAAAEVCKWPGVKAIDKDLLLLYDIHQNPPPV